MKSTQSERAAALERENARLRGDLLTIAQRFSHDLRTPLGGIVSASEAIKEILAEHDPTSLSLVESLVNSGDEMTQIIKQLSFVARASAAPQAKTSVNMGEAVMAARQRLENRLLKRRITVEEAAFWPVVPGVAAWLEMIWWHLLANAWRHGGEGIRVELGWKTTADSWEFFVSDNGRGVAAGLLGQLFPEFQRLHEQPGVRGLGLAIVRRLVELQGGTCTHAIPGTGGATFYFTLPTEKA